MKTWLLVVLLVLPLSAVANSITFSVDSGNVQLNPNISQLLTASRFGTGSFLGFDAGAGPGPYSMTMSWTLILANQMPQVLNFSGSCLSGSSFCGWLDGFNVPTSYKPVPFTLIVQFNSSAGNFTETYHDYYVSNVPEPASFFLLATGMAAVIWLKPWRKRNVPLRVVI
jgi:hypothetical protein